MEVPFYHYYREFEESYPSELEKWQSRYANGSEMDFLDEVENTYRGYILDPFSIEVKEYDFDSKKFIPKNIDCNLLALILKNRIDRIENIVGEEYDYKGFLEGLNLFKVLGEGNFDIVEKNPKFIDNYIIDIKISRWIHFLENEGGGLNMKGGTDLVFDLDKFKDFQFAKKRVEEFITKRREEIKNGINIQNTTGNIKRSDIIATLHETGIIKHLQTKYPSASQRGLARYFEYITNGFIKANNFHSQFTTSSENVKSPKMLKPEIQEHLKDYFNI